MICVLLSRIWNHWLAEQFSLQLKNVINSQTDITTLSCSMVCK